MNTREIKIKRMLMKFDDKLYNLIEEHFKIDMDYNYPEGTYHSFRNDVIQLFAELFGEELYKMELPKKVCDDEKIVDGKISTTFDLCRCCTTCNDCGRYMRYEEVPSEARVIADFICPECYKIRERLYPLFYKRKVVGK